MFHLWGEIVLVRVKYALFEIVCKTASDTERAGEALGRELLPGDVVALYGGLGAGKTAFARGVGRALGAQNVCSPTFTISMDHEGYPVPFVHMDAYRLSGADEFLELGLDEALERAAVVIEWADIVEAALPQRRITLTLQQDKDGARVINVQAQGGANPAALSALRTFGGVS